MYCVGVSDGSVAPLLEGLSQAFPGLLPRSLSHSDFLGERVSFRQINRATGNRLRQQLIDEVTREPVEGSDKARGYEYAKNTYVLIDDEELDAIAIESNHTIEIDKFVPRAQIDERYFDAATTSRPTTRSARTRSR